MIEVDLVGDAGRSAGRAILTFAVVPRPEHLAGLDVRVEPGRRRMGETDEILDVEWLIEVAPTVVRPGTVVLESRREVQNTVGALHGAMHAALVDEASVTLGRSLLGGPCAVVDLQLAYLDLALSSPLTATAEPVGRPSVGDRSFAAVVELRDAEGRLCSHSTVRVHRVGTDD